MNNLQYKVNLLLNSKYTLLLTILLQFSLVLILTNIQDSYTYCMTNENENISEILSTSSVSSIFDYDDDYIEHCVEPLLEHLKDVYNRPYIEGAQNDNLTAVERNLAPIFDYLTNQTVEHVPNPTEFSNKPIEEKINVLQHAYFSESIEKSVLHDALEKQTEQLFRRQDSLIEAKSQVKALTHENLELKNQVDELQRILAETLRK